MTKINLPSRNTSNHHFVSHNFVKSSCAHMPLFTHVWVIFKTKVQHMGTSHKALCFRTSRNPKKHNSVILFTHETFYMQPTYLHVYLVHVTRTCICMNISWSWRKRSHVLEVLRKGVHSDLKYSRTSLEPSSLSCLWKSTHYSQKRIQHFSLMHVYQPLFWSGYSFYAANFCSQKEWPLKKSVAVHGYPEVFDCACPNTTIMHTCIFQTLYTLPYM